MPEVTIRAAETTDAHVVSGHRDAMFRAMGMDEDAVRAASEPALVWLIAALTDGRYQGFLAEADGVVVGGIGVTWIDLPPNMHTTSARRGYILNLFVDPAHRGVGVGGRLLERVLEACRESGVDSVALHASDDARQLYESRGFRATNEMRISLD